MICLIVANDLHEVYGQWGPKVADHLMPFNWQMLWNEPLFPMQNAGVVVCSQGISQRYAMSALMPKIDPDGRLESRAGKIAGLSLVVKRCIRR
jgi:hypothetical protein